MPLLPRVSPILRPLGLVAILALLGACGDDEGATPAGDTGLADIGDDTSDTDTGTLDADPDTTPDADTDEDVLPDADDTTDADTNPGVATRCPTGPAFRWDPEGSDLTVFPDDSLTVVDTSTGSGRRIQISDEVAWLNAPAIPAGLRVVFQQLNTLDGFGINAGMFLRFDGPLAIPPSGATDSVEHVALQLWALHDIPVRIPYEARLTDEDGTILLVPMRPLAEATPHVLVVTQAYQDATGGCVDPGDHFATLLNAGADADGEPSEHAVRLADALDRLEIAPQDVVAAALFTTQSLHDTSRTIAADITTRSPAWETTPVCQPPNGGMRVCDGTFVSTDYRNAAGAITSATGQSTYSLAVRIWLPDTTPPPGAEGSGDPEGSDELPPSVEGPWPTALFGHGLGSGRSQGGTLARYVTPEGFATVAIDAVAHGDHPDAATVNNDALSRILAFFGLNPQGLTLDGLRLRDNFRQSNFDRLQLLQLLDANPDVDGDGAPDLDTTRMAYLGFSLGGIMGPQLLSLTDRFDAAVLGIPGGRVASIIEYAERFAIVIAIMRPRGSGPGDVDRFFPVLQTLIDAGDASSFGPHVMQGRFDERAVNGPHLLMFMALDDDTVPEPCNLSLARALAIPTVPPVYRPTGLGTTTAPAPLSNNWEAPDGTRRTFGLVQLDRETRREGEAPRPATHDYISTSVEGVHLLRRFLLTWRDTGTPVIVDPYGELGTPGLE